MKDVAMWIYGLAALVLVVLIYRFIGAKPRAVAKALGTRMNVRPILIEGMISAMGAERGRLFVTQMQDLHDTDLAVAAHTFVVFEIMKNDNHENIKWWKQRLAESGFEPNMTLESAELAFMYLRDAGANRDQIRPFLEVYNNL